MRVVSWQQSGVAWQPWRVQRCLAGSKVVEYVRTASHGGLESYGLPEVDAVLPNVLDACRGADVLHLHHAYASGEMIAVVRDAFPELKIVVTLHGEPDRSMVRKPCDAAPDAYHVVEPGLSMLGTNAPCTFIPNHPGFEPIPVERKSGQKPQLFIPFSHVAQWKDHGVADHVARELSGEGWEIARLNRRATHAEMLTLLARADAVWVQLQGYFDLLTMECWSLGTIPVVLNLGPPYALEWARRLGFAPIAPFRRRDPIAIASILRDPGTSDSLPVNAAGMRECWTMARCAGHWERFYEGLFR
jgi:hypothetical protein